MIRYTKIKIKNAKFLGAQCSDHNYLFNEDLALVGLHDVGVAEGEKVQLMRFNCLEWSKI